MKALNKLYSNWEREFAQAHNTEGAPCCADRSIANDVLRERLRRSTEMKDCDGDHTIKKIKVYRNGKKVYAEVKQYKKYEDCKVIYALGSRPKAADLSHWQSLPDDKQETVLLKVPYWTEHKNDPVYFTFHVVDQAGVIGKPVSKKVDKSTPKGSGGDKILGNFRKTSEGLYESAPSLTGPQGPAAPLAANTPSITAVHQFSIFSAYVEFQGAADETNIQNYIYSVGSSPGESDLFHAQSLHSHERKTGWHSMSELGLSPGDPFYFNVWAYMDDSTYGPMISSQALSFTFTPLGNGTITYVVDSGGYTAAGDPTAGWSDIEQGELRDFCQKMDPIIREIYGPPAQDMELKFIKDAAYSSSNVFLAGVNEIRSGFFGHWQLVTHEIIHAFHGHVHFENNRHWKFDPTLMGFEEGFAHAVSYLCMNVYAQRYPADLKVGNPNKFHHPRTMEDYDYKNHEHIIAGNFWSAGSGMGLALERYELAASVFFKFYIENVDFFINFNSLYYAHLNADTSETPSRALLISLINQVQSTIEGASSLEWIERQKILSCHIVEGDKVRFNSFAETHFDEFTYVNHAYHYQTFPNGSDWIDADDNYHSYNDRAGFYYLTRVRDGLQVKSARFVPTPSVNPPEVKELAIGGVHLSTDPANSVFLSSQNGEHVKKISLTEQLELYEIQMAYEGSAISADKYYRLGGGPLIKPENKICGAFLLNPDGGGTVQLYHEMWPSRVVTAVVQANTWLADISSWPFAQHPTWPQQKKFPLGKVTIEYTTPDQKIYTIEKNLTFGDKNYGLNLLLIRFQDMKLKQDT